MRFFGLIGTAVGFVEFVQNGNPIGLVLALVILPTLYLILRTIMGKAASSESARLERVVDDLARLTVAALHDIEFFPGGLNCFSHSGVQSFNGSNQFSFSCGDRCDTGTDGLAVEMHGASAALGQAAPILGAGQTDAVTDGP